MPDLPDPPAAADIDPAADTADADPAAPPAAPTVPSATPAPPPDGTVTLATVHPISTFDHRVDGAPTPITRSGTPVPEGLVERILDVARLHRIHLTVKENR